MKHLKDYNQYNQLIQENLLRNFLISVAFSIGLSQADAQTISQDSTKTEIVKDINNYNKLMLINNSEQNLDNLKNQLSKKINDTDVFLNNYLEIQPDRTLIVKPNFINGLELHLRRNLFEIGYNIRF